MSQVIEKLNELNAEIDSELRRSRDLGDAVSRAPRLRIVTPQRKVPSHFTTIFLKLLILLASMSLFYSTYNRYKSSRPIAAPIPTLNASQLHELAVQSYKNKDYVRALEIFRGLIRLDPTNAVLLNNIGLVLKKQGKSAQARDNFLASIREDPKQFAALNNLGALQIVEGDLTQAKTNITRALQLAPDYADARLNLARINESERKLSEAINNYNIYINSSASDPTIRTLLHERIRKLNSLANLQIGGEH